MGVGKDSLSRKLFLNINGLMLIGLGIITLYPFLYVLAASLSSDSFILKGSVGIVPQGLNFAAYQRVIDYPMIWKSYSNTIIYTVVGTAMNLFLTVLGAYPLSRKKFYGRTFFTLFIAFTMWFNAGMIPNFLTVRSYGLYNSMWALLLPTAITTYNLIIMKTFFQQVPESLEEAALIDGCNDIQVLFKIILPLSKASLMTIGLFYAVSHWNSFMPALIYLRDKELYPLQMILREIILQSQASDLFAGDGVVEVGREGIKYATIVVASLPIICVYPFIQKYFVKGAMIGAVKE